MKRHIKLSKIKLRLEEVFSQVDVIKGYSTITITGDLSEQKIPNVVLILNLKTGNIIYYNIKKSAKISNWIEKLKSNKFKVLDDLN